MSLQIITSGPLSLLQDLGRYGHQSIGVTTGGPMDEHAFLWANRLLNNAPNAVQIEVTMGQFSCQFKKETTFSLTGADMGATLNGVSIECWQSHSVSAGDQLTLRGSRAGMRAYIAVKGGFNVIPLLNSCATVMRDQMGGINGDGNKLMAKDTIGYAETTSMPLTCVPPEFIPKYKQSITLDVFLGYQYESFSELQREKFFTSTYQLTPQMDRMGCRLSGEPIQCQNQNLISEGIAAGAIQIPQDGLPIILLKDRQTIGGYPKIGCISAKGQRLLAQCLPGAEIQFVEKDIYEAQEERRIEQAFFESYIGRRRVQEAN